MRHSLQAEAGFGGSSDGDDDDGGSGGGGAASPAHLGLKQWWARDILEEGALGHGEVYTLTADELKSLETDAEGIEQQLLQVRGVCVRESAGGGREESGWGESARKEGRREEGSGSSSVAYNLIPSPSLSLQIKLVHEKRLGLPSAATAAAAASAALAAATAMALPPVPETAPLGDTTDGVPSYGSAGSLHRE